MALPLTAGSTHAQDPLDPYWDAVDLWWQRVQSGAIGDERALEFTAFLEELDGELPPGVVLPGELFLYLGPLCQAVAFSASEQEAHSVLGAGLAVFQRYGQAYHQTTLLGAMGDLEADGYRIEAARGLFDRALAVAGSIPAELESFHHLDRADILMSRADVLRLMDEVDAAQADLERSEQELAATGWLEAEPPPPELLEALGVLCNIAGVRGQVYLHMGLLDLSERAFERERGLAERILSLSPELGEPSFAPAGPLHASLVRGAELQLLAGRFQRVLDDAQELLAAPDVDPAHRQRMLAERALALHELAIAGGAELAEAESALREAALGPQLGDTYLPSLLLARVDALRRLGRYGPCAELLEETTALLSEEHVEGNPWRIDRIRSVALGARLARERGDAVGALGPHLDELRVAWTELLARWENTAPRPGGAGFLLHRERRVVLGELVELCLLLEGPEAALVHVFEAQAKGTMARRYGVAPCTLEAVRRELLEPAGGLLLYLPCGERTYLFLVDGRGVRCERLAPEGELRALQRTLAALAARAPQVGEGNAAELRRTALQLGELALPGVARERLSHWEHLYVSGAELLDGLSLELVPVGGRPLGLKRAVSFLPSTPLGVWLASQDHPPPFGEYELMLLADPLPGKADLEAWPFLNELGFTRAFEQALRAPFEGGRIEFRRGLQARLEALTFPARVKVIWAHGVYAEAPGRERPAALALTSPDWPEGSGLVWCADVERQRTQSALIFLAACGTARGPERMGEDGVASLAGAFLGSGAAAVLAADSPIEANATLWLTSTFLEELRGGAAPAEALRRARVRVAGEQGWDHPAFHSLLRLHGIGHRPLFEPPARRPLWIALLALGLLGGLVLGLLRRRRASGRAPQ